MPKTETANYVTQRALLQNQPIYFARFLHVKTFGAAADYAFSRDFATGTVASSTKIKLNYLQRIVFAPSTIDHENGRATIATAQLFGLDKGGEILRQIAAPALTLKTSMTAGSPTDGGYVELNEDPSGLPSIGTIEITTSGIIERIRYDLVDVPNKKVRVATSGRGADATTAASHSVNDKITNGEQIRPGQRCQLYAGYAPLAESDYRVEAKLEVVRRALAGDWVSFRIDLADVQRTARRQVFLSATQAAPAIFAGNPIEIAMAVLMATGSQTAGGGTIAKTAGSTAIVGSGTSFTSFLAAGDLIGCSDGDIIRVASTPSDNTHFTAAQNVARDGTGITYGKGNANGRYDLLPQTYGLQIPSALVDITGLEALRDAEFAGQIYDFSIIGPTDGKAWVEDEIWKTLNCYPRVTQDGKYSAKRYKITGSSSATLERSSIISWAWALADQGIITQVYFEYDWNLATAKAMFGVRRLYLADQPAGASPMDRYGRRPPLVISSQGIKTAYGGQALLDDRAFQIIKRYADPPAVLNLDIFYSKNLLEAGDCVAITHASIPNPKTGLRGLATELFEIIGAQPFYGAAEGKLRLQLLWLGGIPTQSAPTSAGATTQPDAVSDGTVTTASVVANAITVAGRASNDNDTTFGSTSEIEIATITITPDGGNAIIFATSYLGADGAGGGVTARLRKDSLSGTILDPQTLGAGEVGWPVLIGYDTSPAASQTYKLSVQDTVSASSKYRKPRILALNLKK